MSRVRCAIYTRKSTEQGLEQDFNSLDAQYAACSAYVASQASEGWALLPNRYDDGGVSGGTLERPGLQALMADIAAGHIDIVVVYKVDRLTRSLLDFSKLVEAFDAAGVSFVSITQSFNTTTSMGRLTLNMLLSFAQFEREVTAERIKDKIAASKQRGMWMGGRPPLGYAARNRTLVIVEEEAEFARFLFRRYLELGSVRQLLDALNRDGIQMPDRIAANGRILPGGPFTKTKLFTLLRNPIYAGLIPHGAKRYPGHHSRLIDDELWQAVQARLDANRDGEQQAPTEKRVSPLAGLVFAPDGEPLIASHANKGKVRYRYYVSRHLTGPLEDRAHRATSMRVPARELEGLVQRALADRIADPFRLMQDCGAERLLSSVSTDLNAKAQTVAKELRSARAVAQALMREAISRLVIHLDRVEMEIRADVLLRKLRTDPGSDMPPISMTIPVRVKRSGRAVRLITHGGQTASAAADPSILLGIARGRDWWATLTADPKLSVRTLAQREGLDPGYVGRMLKLAFLDPKLVQQFVNGTAPAHITQRKLLRDGMIVPSWSQQRVALESKAVG